MTDEEKGELEAKNFVESLWENRDVGARVSKKVLELSSGACGSARITVKIQGRSASFTISDVKVGVGQ